MLVTGGTQTSCASRSGGGLTPPRAPIGGMQQQQQTEPPSPQHDDATSNFLRHVSGMLARRRAGEKYDSDAFDAFMLSLVSLDDGVIKDMYGKFELYGSSSPRLDAPAEEQSEKAAFLASLDVPSPEEGLDATSIAFCQLVCEKLGESIGMPRELRVQLHARAATL